MHQNLKTFVDHIFSINPTVSTVHDSSLTVGSRSVSGGGVNNSASDAVFKLREETASLAEIISKGDKDEASVKAQAQKVEGHLMALQTLGQISKQFCDKLLDQLDGIIKG